MSATTTNTARRPSALVEIFVGLYTALTTVSGLSFSNLGRMSDAQLADIGLNRFDVPRAAAADILRR